jgi:hypothetical protein
MAVRVACGVLGEPGRLLIAPHTPQASAGRGVWASFPQGCVSPENRELLENRPHNAIRCGGWRQRTVCT